MHHAPYAQRNAEVIQRFEARRGITVSQAFKEDASTAIFELRVLYGLRCSKCGGGSVRATTFEEGGYSPNVQCWGCSNDQRQYKYDQPKKEYGTVTEYSEDQ